MVDAAGLVWRMQRGTSCGALHVGGGTALVAHRHVSLTLDGLWPTHSGRPGGPYTLVPYIAWLTFSSTFVKHSGVALADA